MSATYFGPLGSNAKGRPSVASAPLDFEKGGELAGLVRLPVSASAPAYVKSAPALAHTGRTADMI